MDGHGDSGATASLLDNSQGDANSSKNNGKNGSGKSNNVAASGGGDDTSPGKPQPASSLGRKEKYITAKYVQRRFVDSDLEGG